VISLDYGKYKDARNASWQCILDFNINKLPVMVTDIIKKSESIRLFKESDVHMLENSESGKTILHNGFFEIVYRDTEPSYRCRFTISHELGHIFLGHLLINTPVYRTFAVRDDLESSANVFARDLLAPACVLHELHATTAEEIAKICNISMQAAKNRAERMQVLEARNKYYLHPLERQVRQQFEQFIEEYRSKM
jgi:Zn-dependent peptidase ImmA (M78 family)